MTLTDVTTVVPLISNSRPLLPNVALLLLTVVPVMLNDDMLVLVLWILTPKSVMPVIELLAIVRLPLVSVSSMPSWLTAPVGVSVTLLRVSVNPATPVPLMPSVPEFVTFIWSRLTALVDVRLMPAPVELLMMPPVPLLAPLMASPVTVSPPLPAAVPVVLRMMPLVAPLAEMLWNVRPAEPIPVFATLSPTPLPELIVLPGRSPSPCRRRWR